MFEVNDFPLKIDLRVVPSTITRLQFSQRFFELIYLFLCSLWDVADRYFSLFSLCIFNSAISSFLFISCNFFCIPCCLVHPLGFLGCLFPFWKFEIQDLCQIIKNVLLTFCHKTETMWLFLILCRYLLK